MDTSKYLEIPFKDKGRFLNEGIDCYGLIMQVYKRELGVELPNYLNYESTTDAFRIPLLFLKEREQWQQVDEPKEYDVVVLNINGQPLHVGVMLDKDKFLHVTKNICVSIESVNSNMWKNRLNGFYRYG